MSCFLAQAIAGDHAAVAHRQTAQGAPPQKHVLQRVPCVCAFRARAPREAGQCVQVDVPAFCQWPSSRRRRAGKHKWGVQHHAHSLPCTDAVGVGWGDWAGRMV